MLAFLLGNASVCVDMSFQPQLKGVFYSPHKGVLVPLSQQSLYSFTDSSLIPDFCNWWNVNEQAANLITCASMIMIEHELALAGLL